MIWLKVWTDIIQLEKSSISVWILPVNKTAPDKQNWLFYKTNKIDSSTVPSGGLKQKAAITIFLPLVVYVYVLSHT